MQCPCRRKTDQTIHLTTSRNQCKKPRKDFLLASFTYMQVFDINDLSPVYLKPVTASKYFSSAVHIIPIALNKLDTSSSSFSVAFSPRHITNNDIKEHQKLWYVILVVIRWRRLQRFQAQKESVCGLSSENKNLLCEISADMTVKKQA